MPESSFEYNGFRNNIKLIIARDDIDAALKDSLRQLMIMIGYYLGGSRLEDFNRESITKQIEKIKENLDAEEAVPISISTSPQKEIKELILEQVEILNNHLTPPSRDIS